MYSEPTISPNFVVRQKRKLRRHPLFIGGVISLVVLAIMGIMTLSSVIGSTPLTETATPVRFESRIVFEATEEPTDDTNAILPDVVIRAETINIAQVEPASETNIEPPLPTETVAQCTISPTGGVNVNIRSGPDMTFSLISVLNARQQVSAITKSENKWYQVLNNDGTIGWVGGSVVDENGNCDTIPTMTSPVCRISNATGNQVNIRAQANTNSAILRTLLPDDILMADGQTQNGWYRILITGQMGWVYKDVVALSDACPTLGIIAADEPLPEPVMSESVVYSGEDCVVESFTGNPVDLHETPDMTSPILAKLNKAMKVNRISTNGWYEIEGFGWAFAGDLVSRGLCSLLPTVTPEQVRSDLLFSSGG